MARLFELRTYYAEPGKFAEMSGRFRNGSAALFAKHGMDVIGFWSPVEVADGEPETLVYLLGFDSKEAAEASWAGFRSDPEWLSLREQSELNGALVAKIESVFMNPTDYSALH